MRSTKEDTVTGGARPNVSRAARNVLSNWTTYLIVGAIGFFLSPFIVRHLGNSAYGVWVLLVSLTGYLGFLDLGIRGAVTRYVAKFHSERSHEQSSYTVSSASGLFIAAGMVAIAFSVLFAVFAVPHFRVPPAYSRTAQIVVVIAGANVAISLISGVFGGVLVGLQRFELYNAIALGVTVLRVVAIVGALKGGKGLISLALIQLGSSLAEFLLGFTFARKLYPELRLATSYFSRPHISLIFSFGFYSFLLLVSNYLIYYTDALVIGVFLPIGFVTFFAIAGNLIVYAKELVGGFSRTMTPLASKLEVESGRQGLQETTLKAARFCSLAVLPIFVTFMIRGHSFIGLWMGPAYADLSGHVLEVLSLPWFLGSSVAVITSVMLGISKHKPIVPVALAEGIGNLVLSIILVRAIGVLGVAWGTAIPNLAVTLFFWPWYVRRTLGVPIRKYVTSLWFVPAIAVVPFAICTYFLDRFWLPRSLVFFALQTALVLPVAFTGIWYFGLRKDERAMYFQEFISPLIRVIRNKK